MQRRTSPHSLPTFRHERTDAETCRDTEWGAVLDEPDVVLECLLLHPVKSSIYRCGLPRIFSTRGLSSIPACLATPRDWFTLNNCIGGPPPLAQISQILGQPIVYSPKNQQKQNWLQSSAPLTSSAERMTGPFCSYYHAWLLTCFVCFLVSV